MQACILSFNNREEVLELPVPLQENWQVSEGHNSYKFTTMETGDVLAIGSRQLKHLVISSFFPARRDYTFLLNRNFPDPWTCVEMIERWKRTNKPIRVVITETMVNYAMAIVKFDAGKMDRSKDVAFTLELEEYRYLNMEKSKRKAEIPSKTLGQRPSEKKTTEVQSYKIKKGDTLWDLSEKYLGDGRKWKELAKANQIKNGYDLKVGQKIKIPPRESNKKVGVKEAKPHAMFLI